MVAFVGCAGSCRAPVTPVKDSVTILLTSDVLGLDPNHDIESVTNAVVSNSYETLVGFDANLELKPLLAESWEHPRPELWRFALRHNVRFHDGVPLTASLVRDALLAVQQATAQETSSFLAGVKSVAAIDEHTLDIETLSPRSMLANLPFAYITKKNTGGDFPPLVGTGPYRIVEWTRGSRVLLERWDGFRGPAPLYRTARFEPVRDAEARVARLREGSADIAYAVPPELAIQGPAGVRFVRHSGLNVFYLGFDIRDRPDNPFRDLRVRKAFHLGLDRKAIVRRLLLGMGSIPTQPVAPLVFGFNPELPVPGYDVGEAHRLLAEAGHPHGIRVRLDSSDIHLAAMQVMQESLRASGIELELNPLPKEAFRDKAKAGASEFFFLGWNCSTGEASEFYEWALHTPDARFGRGNFGGYSNLELDRIAETNPTILDQRERKAQLQRAAAIAMHDLPVLPVFIRDEIYGVREPIRFRARADSEVKLAELGSIAAR